MGIQGFSHFGVCVSDPERSMRFYCDLLGFETVSKLVVSDPNSTQLCGLKDMELHAYFLQRDGVRIELLHYKAPGHEGQGLARPMNGLGLTHFAMRVQGLDEILAAARAAGFEVMEETHIQNPELHSSVAFVLDPDGTRVELIELPGDPAQPLGDPLTR